MKRLSIVSGLAALLGMAGVAFAQDNTQLSEADCLAIWTKADAAGAGNIDSAQAQPYVVDFSAVDADANGTLTLTEFQAGCANGMVQDSAASGAGAGTEGSDAPLPPAAPQE
jgi:hypothetical protein